MVKINLELKPPFFMKVSRKIKLSVCMTDNHYNTTPNHCDSVRYYLVN